MLLLKQGNRVSLSFQDIIPVCSPSLPVFSDTAYPYLLTRVQTLPASSSPDVAKSASLDLVVTSLHLPLTFDLSELVTLKTLQTHLANHPIYVVLGIFSKGDLVAWDSWRKEHATLLADLGKSHHFELFAFISPANDYLAPLSQAWTRPNSIARFDTLH